MAQIKNLIVLMLENRSFDHMLGFLKGPGYDIDGLSGAEANVDTTGQPVQVTRDARYGGDFDPDPGHDFDDVTVQLYGAPIPGPGQTPDMSGFVKSYAAVCKGLVPASHRIMKCFDPQRLPVLATLARQFAVCDRWFSSLPGPTLPNRLFAHCGTSAGRLDMSPQYFRQLTTVYEILDKADVGATIYSDGWTSTATFPYLLKFQDQFFGTMEQFFNDCDDDELPPYSFVEPRYSSGMIEGTFRPQSDQHPDSDVFEGEKLVRRIYERIRSNKKLWEKAVLVITYDEHGGFFDHVPPPAVDAPDDLVSTNPNFDFKRLGVRVPAVVISPYINAGTICRDMFDHTSLIATAMDLFNVPRSKMPGSANAGQPAKPNARVAKANNIVQKCLNRNDVRTDTVPFPPMEVGTTAPPEPARLNDLQEEYVKQAAHLEQLLPPQLRTGKDVSQIRTDRDADAYISEVFARVRAHPVS